MSNYTPTGRERLICYSKALRAKRLAIAKCYNLLNESLKDNATKRNKKALTDDERRNIEEYISQRPAIVVFGQVNSGKSTFLNYLLGCADNVINYLPVCDTPTTKHSWLITCDKVDKLEAIDDRSNVLCRFASIHDTKRLTTFEEECTGKPISSVMIRLSLSNNEMLNSEIDLIDTVPSSGHGTSYYDSIYVLDKEKLCLPIFLIHGQQLLTMQDCVFLHKVRSMYPDIKFLYVINRIDVSNQEFLMDYSSEEEDNFENFKTACETEKIEAVHSNLIKSGLIANTSLANSIRFGAMSVVKTKQEKDFGAYNKKALDVIEKLIKIHEIDMDNRFRIAFSSLFFMKQMIEKSGKVRASAEYNETEEKIIFDVEEIERRIIKMLQSKQMEFQRYIKSQLWLKEEAIMNAVGVALFTNKRSTVTQYKASDEEFILETIKHIVIAQLNDVVVDAKVTYLTAIKDEFVANLKQLCQKLPSVNCGNTASSLPIELEVQSNVDLIMDYAFSDNLAHRQSIFWQIVVEIGKKIFNTDDVIDQKWANAQVTKCIKKLDFGEITSIIFRPFQELLNRAVVKIKNFINLECAMECCDTYPTNQSKQLNNLKHRRLITVLMSALYGVHLHGFCDNLISYTNNNHYKFYLPRKTDVSSKLWLTGKFSMRVLPLDNLALQKQLSYLSKNVVRTADDKFVLHHVGYTLSLEGDVLVVYEHFDHILHAILTNESTNAQETNPILTAHTCFNYMLSLTMACKFLRSVFQNFEFDLRPESIMIITKTCKLLMIPPNRDKPYPCNNGPYHFAPINNNSDRTTEYQITHQLKVIWWFSMIQKVEQPPSFTTDEPITYNEFMTEVRKLMRDVKLFDDNSCLALYNVFLDPMLSLDGITRHINNLTPAVHCDA